MNHKHKDADIAVERLKQKYIQRRKKLLSSEENTRETCAVVPRTILASRSNRNPSKEMKYYNKSLHELLKAVINPPDRLVGGRSLCGSDENLSGDCTALPLHDSQVLCTETDVTLPSCLNGSPGSWESDANRNAQCGRQRYDSYPSSPSFLAKVYREMTTIYEQLKAERLSQQQWEKELQERERRLEQQEKPLDRLAKVEDVLHGRILAVEEKHQHEVSQLQDLLRDKSKENRRLKSSFETMKELNDAMKTQLSVISEQNKKLENQSKRLQARLDNLQRKHEHSLAVKGLQKACVKSSQSTKPSKLETNAASGKPSTKLSPQSSSGPTTPKLLALLLDWVLDGHTFCTAAGDERKGLGPCLPSVVSLNERCLKALPLLADQLHRAPSAEPDLILSLLRLTHCTLRHMDNTMQHVALSATLRRIGEEVSKAPARSSAPQHLDPPDSCTVRGGPFRTWPLYRSPCPPTRILSSLILLRTVTQADVLAQAVGSLHADLACEESRGLFVHYGGVCAILSVLRAGRGAPHTLVDILMQLTEQSRYLTPFLEACSCEEFFRTASQLLKNSRLELPSLEKLSILLQKLSNIRTNRRLFESCSLHLHIQELYHNTERTHSFLRLNLRSILHNLQ
ncbi:coiled-coil domain-containing protein 138 [Genypterus blacodes]|uniref:coiled-coil domain-containing protein 138 n=1 Tax=Genypterus blacodes TaxID=154954 RepID=UPI003F75F7A4